MRKSSVTVDGSPSQGRSGTLKSTRTSTLAAVQWGEVAEEGQAPQ